MCCDWTYLRFLAFAGSAGGCGPLLAAGAAGIMDDSSGPRGSWCQEGRPGLSRLLSRLFTGTAHPQRASNNDAVGEIRRPIMTMGLEDAFARARDQWVSPTRDEFSRCSQRTTRLGNVRAILIHLVFFLGLAWRFLQPWACIFYGMSERDDDDAAERRGG